MAKSTTEKYCVVFDLDACCWYPEMFMLWGGGAPFKQDSTAVNNTLIDSKGTKCRLLGDVAACWAECHSRMQAGQPLIVGVASRSDEPTWARECLNKFMVKPGVSMMDVVTESLCEIYKGSKRDHFAALHKKTGVPYKRMCFFDGWYSWPFFGRAGATVAEISFAFQFTRAWKRAMASKRAEGAAWRRVARAPATPNARRPLKPVPLKISFLSW